MDFEVKHESIRSDSLEVDFFQVPWDSEILGYPVAQISHIRVLDQTDAAAGFQEFSDWIEQRGIRLCCSRVSHDHVTESLFLQQHGYRFIELNYQPERLNLASFDAPEKMLTIQKARPEDQEPLVDMASEIFESGRFHQDPRIGKEIGNLRYGIWMRNSFTHPDQEVYVCSEGGEIKAFFVVEFPGETHCHWSLIGLAPGLGGRGIGTRVWQSMLHFHRLKGIRKVSTSISSHNTAVLNLYVKLGFSFPPPSATFHWFR